MAQVRGGIFGVSFYTIYGIEKKVITFGSVDTPVYNTTGYGMVSFDI